MPNSDVSNIVYHSGSVRYATVKSTSHDDAGEHVISEALNWCLLTKFTNCIGWNSGQAAACQTFNSFYFKNTGYISESR